MRQPVGIRALAVSFPKTIRTNDYWRTKYPELVEQAEEKNLAKTFSVADSIPDSPFDVAMRPYLLDTFRGTVERRILIEDESPLMLEKKAATDALQAAQLLPEQVDLMLVASIFPEQIVPGNASYLAGVLGLQGAAWNIESTCSSALVAHQTACALVRSGEYRNVLVVVSNTYSRLADERDSFSWFLGDGAGAFVVGELKENQGILSTKILNTSSSCGSFFCEFINDAEGRAKMMMRASKDAPRMFRDTTKFIRKCCDDAIAAAGVTLEEIDFFIFNTPMAWYADVCTRVLGIDPERTIDMNAKYANIGAVLPVSGLYHAAYEGKIRENDLVLIYTIGSSSNAGASLVRWGDVAIGPFPEASIGEDSLNSKVAVGVR
ncbi:3-oxoacyl-ACP synthase III family protein [Spirulina sp. 06S082]|uniref:3-oxoacyl-ACP synthase III family protein n=1 Tax=Spirulina sp. 06S082 TaxID=3110248 RepID=UPI002B1F241D|nr:3-oxoacyl-ACP synthase III family protein [Spirulina sp. 06S082]MEA5472068.1 3-oxoacyl-ACP synthase III family protein [Spirulina sp. 06S082]